MGGPFWELKGIGAFAGTAHVVADIQRQHSKLTQPSGPVIEWDKDADDPRPRGRSQRSRRRLWTLHWLSSVHRRRSRAGAQGGAAVRRGHGHDGKSWRGVRASSPRRSTPAAPPSSTTSTPRAGWPAWTTTPWSTAGRPPRTTSPST
jgi:hypothetical protein